MKTFTTAFAMILFCAVTIGCGNESGTKSVYQEDEMAKYRQSPEEMRAGMMEAEKASRSRGKEMTKAAREAKKAAALEAKDAAAGE